MCMTIKYQVRSSSLLTKGTSPNLALEAASILFVYTGQLCCIWDFEIKYPEFDMLVGSKYKKQIHLPLGNF